MSQDARDPIVVVGSGPSGLIQALHLARNRGRRVVIVEQQARNGGMFGSVRTPWGLVDQGVHILQETGIAELDQLLFEAIPESQWHIYEGSRKDIAGNFFLGRLDQGSLYPDLRRLDATAHARIVEELTACAAKGAIPMSSARHLGEYFESRFGPLATELVFRPIASKLWNCPLEELSPWAAKVVHLSRVVTHGNEDSLRLKSSPTLDRVLGFPDQLAFPKHLQGSRRRALYPKKFGMTHVVDGLCAALDRHDVERLNGARIEKLEVVNGRVNAIGLTSNDGPRRIPASAVLWTSPPQPLLAILGIRAAEAADAPIPHRIIHLFFDAPPSTGALYWLWSYDPGNSIVRVSNPAAYCPDAGASRVYPVCVEMHSPASASDEAAITRADEELRSTGLVGPGVKRVGASVLPGNRGFFVPTLTNCAASSAQRRAVEDLRLLNLSLSSQDVGSGLFYLADMLVSGKRIIDAMP